MIGNSKLGQSSIAKMQFGGDGEKRRRLTPRIKP
jgi:hypothetical protein